MVATKITYSYGVYEGDVVNGEPHGRGKMKYSWGDVYEGDWENGNKHGKGTYKWTDGRVYVGDWKDDLRSGKGVVTYANGDVYDGEWKDGKKHGKGSFTTKNGDVKTGDWFNGKSKNLTLLTRNRAVNTQDVGESAGDPPASAATRPQSEELRSTIAQLQKKNEEKDKEIASMRVILEYIREMLNKKGENITNNEGREGPSHHVGHSAEKEKEHQLAIDQYKKENDSLKKQLKKLRSRPIDLIDLTHANDIEEGTSSSEEGSNPCEPPSKRHRTKSKSNLAGAWEQNQQMVAVKVEANQRAAVAEAHLEVVRREKNDLEASLREMQADLQDANELTGQQTLATDIWQGRFDEVFELARAAGVDANRLFEIRNRPLSSGS